MRIPKSVNSLSVKTYMEFIKIESSNLESIDKATKLLSLLTGWSVEYIENFPVWKTEFWFKRLSKIRATTPTTKLKRFIWVNGNLYKLIRNEKDFNANQFTAWEHFSLTPRVNFHNLCSLIYYPVLQKNFNPKKQTALSVIMLNAKVGSVFGALFFYLINSKKLKLVSHPYSKQADIVIQKRVKEMMEQCKDLGISTDGTMSSILSRVETHLAKMN